MFELGVCSYKARMTLWTRSIGSELAVPDDIVCWKYE